MEGTFVSMNIPRRMEEDGYYGYGEAFPQMGRYSYEGSIFLL